MARHDTKSELLEPMRFLSLVRMALGAVSLLAPGVLVRLFAGTASTPNTRVLARAFASREVALGAVTFGALEQARIPPGVLELNMLADGSDAVSTLLAWRRLPRLGRVVTLVGAIGAVATAARLRDALRA